MAQSFLESETAAVEVIPQVCAIQVGTQASMPSMQGSPSCCRRLSSVCGHHEMQQVERNVHGLWRIDFRSDLGQAWRCLDGLSGLTSGKEGSYTATCSRFHHFAGRRPLARCSCIDYSGNV